MAMQRKSEQIQERQFCPVQRSHLLPRDSQVVPRVVHLRAYEAYVNVFGKQPAMIEGECRGGFGIGELVAFLYVRSFPVAEQKARFEEALEGMKL